jgi:hypothetical protein
MSFIWRLRLFVGGELSRLATWTLPKVEMVGGCDKEARWAIYGKYPNDVTYSCTDHLSDMVTDETQRIEPNQYVPVDCHYLYSTDELPELAEI